MPRHALALLAMLLVVVSSCSGDGSDDPSPSTAAAFDCTGLADRWATIQQGYLDRIGDADLDELDAGSDRFEDAMGWFGPAMIEQVRDAGAVGCDDEFVAGSPMLCARIDLLEPGGEAGHRVVADLDASCDGG